MDKERGFDRKNEYPYLTSYSSKVTLLDESTKHLPRPPFQMPQDSYYFHDPHDDDDDDDDKNDEKKYEVTRARRLNWLKYRQA